MTRLISVTDGVYAMLARLKHSDESFSKLFTRLLTKGRKKESIMDYAGAFKDMPEIDGIFAEILARRHVVQRKPVRL